MYYADGEPIRFLGVPGTAMGWLEAPHPFATGTPAVGLREKLAELLSGFVWEPGHLMGYHACNLRACRTGNKIRGRVMKVWMRLFILTMGRGRTRSELETSLKREAMLNDQQTITSLYSAPQREVLRLRMLLLREQVKDLAKATLCGSLQIIDYLINRGSHRQMWKGRKVDVGATNLYIPGADTIYIAPSMIFHYICAHRYRPSNAFCDAVLNCPPMLSRAYFAAFKPGLQIFSTQEEGFSSWVSAEFDFWTALIAQSKAQPKERQSLSRVLFDHLEEGRKAVGMS
jgi:hypothetical protein